MTKDKDAVVATTAPKKKVAVPITAGAYVSMKGLRIGWKGRLETETGNKEMTYREWDSLYEKMRTRRV